MKPFARAVIWAGLMSGGLAAGPVYQVGFTGTITSGTLKDFNLTTNTSEQVADLTGMPVSGWMRFDLGVAPAPSVGTSGGFTTTSIQSSGGPFFASEHFVLGTIPLTADFLPVPAIFDLPPIPAFPGGGTVTETTDNQSLSDTTGAPGFSQAILGAMDFVYSRDTAQFHSADLVALAALVNSTQQFFPIPAPGQFPGSWSITNPGGNAIFSFFELVQDKAIADATHHFGLSSDYDVAGNLTLDSASGGLVAPEPGTLPVMVGLALVWGIRRATSGRRGARAAESARASARTAAGAAFSFSSRGTTLSKVSAALCGME